MSIASEITRLQTAKADLKTAIEGKGVTVPAAATLDDYADLVDDIQTGGGGGFDADGYVESIYPSGELNFATTEEIPTSVKFTKWLGITKINAPELTTVAAQAFSDLNNVTQIIAPKLTTLGAASFSGFRSLQGGHFPALRDNVAFYYGGQSAAGDTVWVFPAAQTLGSEAFRNGKFTVVDLGKGLAALNTRSFYQGSSPSVVIFRNPNSVVSAPDSNSISIISSTTKVYVPSALISNYQSATNWSTKGSIFYAIEGSQYENYYADGTPINA